MLAYSTVSQIGYMFLAVGLGQGGYAIGIIHLLGHGFFKAALFLSAGSVMHAMNDRINMRRFGGLCQGHADHLRCVPVRLSRDHRVPVRHGLLHQGQDHRGGVRQGRHLRLAPRHASALLGAGLTAFYMTRALVMTFFGERRWEDDVHPHEAQPIMTVPMIMLGILSLVGGFLLTSTAACSTG